MIRPFNKMMQMIHSQTIQSLALRPEKSHKARAIRTQAVQLVLQVKDPSKADRETEPTDTPSFPKLLQHITAIDLTRLDTTTDVHFHSVRRSNPALIHSQSVLQSVLLVQQPTR
jgi:hypothetical protein